MISGGCSSKISNTETPTYPQQTQAEETENTFQKKTGNSYVGRLRRDFLKGFIFIFGEFKEEVE